MPEADRSNEQTKYLSSFKWQHTKDPKAKRPWNPPGRPREDQRRNYDDRRSRRARGGGGKRHRSPSSESYSEDDAHSRNRRSRRGRSNRNRSPSQSRSRSRSPVARRGPDGDGGRDGNPRSRRASLFKRT